MLQLCVCGGVYRGGEEADLTGTLRMFLLGDEGGRYGDLPLLLVQQTR